MPAWRHVVAVLCDPALGPSDLVSSGPLRSFSVRAIRWPGPPASSPLSPFPA